MSNKLFAFVVDTITDPDSWKGSFGPEKGIKNELQLNFQILFILLTFHPLIVSKTGTKQFVKHL